MADEFDPAFIESVVEHMNVDHDDAVKNYMLAFAPENARQSRGEFPHIKMVDARATGITLEQTNDSGGSRRFDISFASAGLPAELEGPEQIRSALVAMAKKARVIIGN